jgi:Emfourin
VLKVKIERRGGLLGKLAVGEMEETALTPAQRQALDKLIKSPPKPTPSPGADRFQYKIRVWDEKGEHEFEVPEDSMPDELAAKPKVQL